MNQYYTGILYSLSITPEPYLRDVGFDVYAARAQAAPFAHGASNSYYDIPSGAALNRMRPSLGGEFAEWRSFDYHQRGEYEEPNWIAAVAAQQAVEMEAFGNLLMESSLMLGGVLTGGVASAGFDVAQGLMSGDSLSDIAMNSTGLSLASDAAGALGALSTNLFCFPATATICTLASSPIMVARWHTPGDPLLTDFSSLSTMTSLVHAKVRYRRGSPLR